MLLIGLVLAGTGHYLGGSGLDRLYAGLWRMLGVKVETPAPVDVGQGDPGSPGAAGTPDEDGQGPVLAPDAIIVRVLRYGECGCEETQSQTVGASMAGLDKVSLAREFRDCTVTAFSAERAELTITVPGWCPDHKWRTVRLEDGRLLLYAGSLEAKNLIFIRVIETRGTLDSYSTGFLTEGHSSPDEETLFRLLEGIGD